MEDHPQYKRNILPEILKVNSKPTSDQPEQLELPLIVHDREQCVYNNDWKTNRENMKAQLP